MSQIASDAKISSAMAALGMTAPLPNLDDSQVLKAILVAMGNLTAGLIPAGSTITDIINNVVNPTEFSVGYLGVPVNSQSADYTVSLTDSGKQIYHPTTDATPRIWTIPANASVAFPLGTAITFNNDTGAGAITIAITTDTMVLAGAGSTGSRTLAADGIATAVKMTATRWKISGSGLT